MQTACRGQSDSLPESGPSSAHQVVFWMAKICLQRNKQSATWNLQCRKKPITWWYYRM